MQFFTYIQNVIASRSAEHVMSISLSTSLATEWRQPLFMLNSVNMDSDWREKQSASCLSLSLSQNCLAHSMVLHISR
jgi:hypothetical protein